MKLGLISNVLVRDFRAEHAVVCPVFKPEAVIVEAAAGYVVGARIESFRGVECDPIFRPQRQATTWAAPTELTTTRQEGI